MKTDRKKLDLWRERLELNAGAYDGELGKMQHREDLYHGSDDIYGICDGDDIQKTCHVRNIVSELVESQIDPSVPQPKVTARRKKDEDKAKIIEDMLRSELDRMSFEEKIDLCERVVPIQGGAGWLCEWDNSERTQTTVGELCVSVVHPKQLIPQNGVYSGIEDMDYFIVRHPTTKEYIRKKYGADVSGESESAPEARGSDEYDSAADMVTQYIAYYRSEHGIGVYSWVNDIQLEDIEDYQARRLRRCSKCGMPDVDCGGEYIGQTNPDGTPPVSLDMPYDAAGDAESAVNEVDEEIPESGEKTRNTPSRGGVERGVRVCRYCGCSKFEDSNEEYEELWNPVMRSDGTEIPGAVAVSGGETTDPITGVSDTAIDFQPTKIPYYKPDIFPLILQKNVSSFGQLLGESDVDKIMPQQNTINRLSQKIINMLIMGGSYLTLPDDSSIPIGAKDMQQIRIRDASQKNMIGVEDMQANIEQPMAYMEYVYQEARQIVGITDSYQGRTDKTATSGTAKQFAAAQSAGRLESKRVMKAAAFANLFEAMFKFKLAYTDEPRPVAARDLHGEPQYEEFNRYDFLEQDETGEWYWNDDFCFSVDVASPLSQNREAMWQETRQNFESGSFGDPAQTDTLILFWTKMEALHYPDAAQTKQYLTERAQREAEQAQQMAQMQQQQAIAQSAAAQAESETQRSKIDADRNIAAEKEKTKQQAQLISSVEAAAKEAAQRDAQSGNVSRAAQQNAAIRGRKIL